MPQELSKGCSQWGAQMGRMNTITEPDFPVKFRMEKLRWTDQCYDQGGAYWGSGDPIFHAWGDADQDEQEIFIRAKDRDDAKAQVREKFPNARFYR